MTDTLNKQKGNSNPNGTETPLAAQKRFKEEYRQQCEDLKKELEELKKQKQLSDDKFKAVSSEVHALRHVIVNMSKIIYGV